MNASIPRTTFHWSWCDIAAAGSSYDGQIFQYSDLRRKIECNTTGFHTAVRLMDEGPKVSNFILLDNVFPLRTWRMKPFSCSTLDINTFKYQIH